MWELILILIVNQSLQGCSLALPLELSTSHEARIFTNPFGILGHPMCETRVQGRNLTGGCFNQVECFVRGGTPSGYCSPLSGVCCVFVNRICDRTVNHKVSYFANANYPNPDEGPQVCTQTLKLRSTTCWLKVDYEEFEIESGNGGQCVFDTFSIVSNNGTFGSICGNRTRFSHLIRTDPGGSVKFVMLVQTSSYKWIIKSTQIPCDQVQKFTNDEQCGEFDEDPNPRTISDLRRVKKKRRRRPRSIDKQFPYRSRPYQPTSAFLAKESNVLLKIVDGTQSRLHAFPWAASLSFVGGFHGCGGSLIRNDMIITAAHCVETPGFAEFIRVTLGEHDLSRPDETSFTVTRRVKRVILHPSYTAFLIGLPGDIALIILEDPVPFNQGIKPVCLPTNSPVGTFDNRMGIAAGWGLTENETNPDVIRQVDLNIISLEQCTTEWRLLDGLELTPAMICTFNGPLGTGSTCRGDSGGPLMVLEGTKQVLVGVTSFGTQNCSDPVSSVYSRVTYFMDWISAALSVFS